MKKMIAFTVGAVGYPFIEVAWRGFSHWTMELAGGICFLFIYIMDERMTEVRLLRKCIIGALFITCIELIIGLIVNKLLHWNVWNYSDMPFNFVGQICLPYAMLWFLLVIPLIYLSRFLHFIFSIREQS